MNLASETGLLLKTRRFSVFHIEIFELILLGKTNLEINKLFGYTKRSHAVVDHSRKVMYKLLALENLNQLDYSNKVVYPRKYQLWWKKLLDKHSGSLYSKAILHPGTDGIRIDARYIQIITNTHIDMTRKSNIIAGKYECASGL